MNKYKKKRSLAKNLKGNRAHLSLTLFCVYLDSVLFRFYPSKAVAR